MKVLYWLGFFVCISLGALSAYGVWMFGTFEAWLTLVTAFLGVLWFAFMLFLDNHHSNQNSTIKVLSFLASLFPVLLFVFVIRFFLFEPFRIPSGSMQSTLHIGDFVLVKKFEYGLRLPIVGTRIIGSGTPERGDVVVFRFPHEPGTDYIKRTIGLPGDEILIEGHRLTINGQVIKFKREEIYTGNQTYDIGDEVFLVTEHLGTHPHQVLHETQGAKNMRIQNPFPKRQYFEEARNAFGQWRLKVSVPEGHYFMMGDNRDNSSDSRIWGLVPDKYLKGQAIFVWMNYDGRLDGFDFSRFGKIIE